MSEGPRARDTADDAALEAARRTEYLRALGRLDDAERTARTALAEAPQDTVLLCELAAVLLGAERYAEGLAVADAAVAAAPDQERGHRLRGLMLSMLGRHAEALQAGYVAVSLAPNEAYAATGYARVLQRAGRLADAAQVARRVVELTPASAQAHILLADITSDLGDRRTARSAYGEALRLDPESAVAQHDLAVLDARAHRPARALRGLLDAGRLAPGSPQVLQTVVAVLWQLSWRVRIWFLVATLVLLVAAGGDQGGGRARLVAGAILLATAALGWWTTRDLPRRTWPVVRAAVRSDLPLTITYVTLAACLALYVAVVGTGLAALGGLVWLALLGLGWFALVIRIVRRRRVRH